MDDAWLIAILLAATTMALKMSGPLLIGKHDLPAWAVPVIDVLPGAMLTALIVIQAVTDGGRIVIDERICGLAVAAGILLWRRQALVPAVLSAAIVVALLRAVL